DHLARVAAIGRAARDEIAEFVARDRQSPVAGGADPDADLGAVARPLVNQPPRRMRGARNRIGLRPPVDQIAARRGAVQMRGGTHSSPSSSFAALAGPF